jgi:hypothetical protein
MFDFYFFSFLFLFFSDQSPEKRKETFTYFKNKLCILFETFILFRFSIVIIRVKYSTHLNKNTLNLNLNNVSM